MQREHLRHPDSEGLSVHRQRWQRPGHQRQGEEQAASGPTQRRGPPQRREVKAF